MKKILLITLLVAFVFSSCKKDTQDISRITTYASMSMNGASNMFWQLNTAFVDPGCKAMEGTTDLTSKIVVTSNVDITKYGKYTITYKVQNSDGFDASVSRTVYVCEKTAALNGFYKSTISRNNAGTIASRGPFTVVLYGVANGNYKISDLLGGWYDFGSAYGSTYAGSAVLKLNADNTFSIVSANSLAWGYPCEFTSGTTSTYDAGTKTLVLNTNMQDAPNMKFTVTLNNPTQSY